MKKIFICALVITAGIFVSCSEDDSRFENNPESGWVQFQNSTPSEVLFKEGGTISIPVILKAPVNESGLVVNYSISNISGSTEGALSYDSKVMFDEATNTANLVLTMVGASLSDAIEFDVTLVSTSKSTVSIGLVDEVDNIKPIVKRVKICSNEFTTSYVGTSQATIDGAPAFEGWNPTVSLVSGTTNSFQFDTLWGSGLVPLLSGDPSTSVFKYPGIVTINDDNTVTVVGINDPAFPNRYQGGTGTYNPCTKVITYRLSQGLFTNAFQVDVVLMPN